MVTSPRDGLLIGYGAAPAYAHLLRCRAVPGSPFSWLVRLGDTLDRMSDSERSSLTGTEDDRRMLAQWASECVERVLPVFQERHPDDDRLRKAVEAT